MIIKKPFIFSSECILICNEEISPSFCLIKDWSFSKGRGENDKFDNKSPLDLLKYIF